MPTDPAAARPPRPSRARRSAPRRQTSRIPVTIRYGLPLVVAVLLAREAWNAWSATRAHLQLVDPAGEPLEVAATAEFFAYDDDPAAPSPTPSLGTRAIGGDGALTVGTDLIGEAALVRLEVPGHGVGYGLVEAGADVCELRLGTPTTVRGVVVDAAGAPVAGARVLAFGGGARGVLLGESVTEADGTFAFAGISDTVRNWSFRVFADGYAVGQHDWLSQPEEVVRVPLLASAPALGRLVVELLEPGVDAPPLGDLELRIFHLPGVTARTAADGSFAVPYLPPPPSHAYVLVPGLPSAWTYRRTALQAGDVREVRLVPSRVVRGRVVNGHDGRGVAGAVVYHDHGPHGVETVRCDADGRFELGRVPLGSVEVHAFVRIDRRTVPAAVRREKGRGQRVSVEGSVPLMVRPGADPDAVVITLW